MLVVYVGPNGDNLSRQRVILLRQSFILNSVFFLFLRLSGARVLRGPGFANNKNNGHIQYDDCE